MKTRLLSRLLTSAVFICLTAPASALAHDASMHKGKVTVGKITTMAHGKLSVETENGPVVVTLSEGTRIEDEGGGPAAVGDLRMGDAVTVTGTRLAGGELVAKEVMIRGDAEREGKTHAKAPAYSCTMHPEIASDRPGNCPKCGMKLVRKD